MDYQEKFAAINAVAEASLLMRKPGDWYVSQPTEITSDSSAMLSGKYGNGETPEKAIDAHWDELTRTLKPDEYVVIHAGDPKRRRHLRWNGYMWEDLPRNDQEHS